MPSKGFRLSPTGETAALLAIANDGEGLQRNNTVFVSAPLPLNTVEGRLTLTSGTAITTSNVTAATTVYFTPYKGNRIYLFDGTRWRLYSFSEISVAVPATTTTPFDIFAFDSAGSVTLETTNWTSDTARATALVLQNGVQVRSGATTRRYLGTGRTTGVSGQTEDSLTSRYLWNYYNRVSRKLKVTEDTASWTSTNTVFHSWNSSTANRVNMVIGSSEDLVYLYFGGSFDATVNTTPALGVGVDSTSVNSVDITNRADAPSGESNGVISVYEGYPGIGGHFLQLIERAGAAGTTTFSGDNGDLTIWPTGGVGMVLG